MIDITVKKTPYDYRIKIVGHAGYNPGNDIVCSAVSALTYVLAHTASGLQSGEYEVEMKEGDTYIYVCPREQKEVFRVFDEIVAGYKAIAKEYRRNVKVHG